MLFLQGQHLLRGVSKNDYRVEIENIKEVTVHLVTDHSIQIQVDTRLSPRDEEWTQWNCTKDFPLHLKVSLS
jgi:hypothetical protein